MSTHAPSTISCRHLPAPSTAGTPAALLVVYAVEGFLRRLAASPHAVKMALKGGILMAATSARRMTKDADLSTVGITHEQTKVAEVVQEIAVTGLDVDDGLTYDITSIRTEVMREHAEYQGVRVKLQAHLATARMTTTLDFSFGDPHRSVIVELPELLGDATIRLACYPPELTLAEKIATMMSRRELNTRDRDFADVWVLSRLLDLPAAVLRSAIREVAGHRSHDVLPLFEALADMPDRQAPYSAMLARMSYQRVPPALWAELLADVKAFVDPLIVGADGELTSWNAEAMRWI
jgi:Nucleotidyl transferase AbiEii toxin, Type IV TA system